MADLIHKKMEYYKSLKLRRIKLCFCSKKWFGRRDFKSQELTNMNNASWGWVPSLKSSLRSN